MAAESSNAKRRKKTRTGKLPGETKTDIMPPIDRDRNGRFIKGAKGKPKGAKNIVTRTGKHNIHAAFERASLMLGLPETFDPMNELIKLVKGEELGAADKAAVYVKMLGYIYPQKRAMEIQLSPGVIPSIAVIAQPDEEGMAAANGLLPPGTLIVPGQPIVINIGGSSEKKESEDEILL